MTILGTYGYSYVFQYNSELFPSHVRGFTIGSATLVSNFVSAGVPFLGSLVEARGIHFVSILTPFALLAFVGAFILPETVNKKLEN